VEGGGGGFFRHGGSLGGVALGVLEREVFRRVMETGKGILLANEAYGGEFSVLTSSDLVEVGGGMITFDMGKRMIGGMEEDFVGLRFGISF